MAISLEDIKTLRAKTSAGMGLCKEALVASKGDMAKAMEYVNARSDVISRLHNLTGAKIGLCKTAFDETGKDFEKAVELINKRGWAQEIVKDDAGPKEGIISVYVHGSDQKTVAMIELTCVTDFVAKSDKFRDFGHELAMQAAAMKPEFISKESIAQEKIDEMTENFKIEAKAEGKPEKILEKIVEGKLQKFFEEKCLMSQKWFKDENKTMTNLLDENVTHIGEPITIRRMIVWKFGE